MTRNAGTLGFNFDAVKKQALDGLVDDPDAGQQQEAGLDKGGEILELAVPVLVIGIGGLVGNPHGKERYQGGDQVQSGVCRFDKIPSEPVAMPTTTFKLVMTRAASTELPATARFSRRIDPELKWLESLA